MILLQLLVFGFLEITLRDFLWKNCFLLFFVRFSLRHLQFLWKDIYDDMFGKFTYLGYTVIFTIPLIVATWIYYWPILKKKIKVITFLVTLLTMYGSILMALALHIHAWSYANNKFLGIYFLGVVLEDIIWWVCILLLEVSAVVVLMVKKDTNKSILSRD